MEEIKKNRKLRRLEAALKRRSPTVARDPNHWFKRIVKEMQENKEVIEKVTSGKLDKYLV